MQWYFTGETVDLYNPKCVRSAVGIYGNFLLSRLKIFRLLKIHFASFEKVATLPKAQDTLNLKNFKAKSPYLIMFGAESSGLSKN